jgi:hypothetical protein
LKNTDVRLVQGSCMIEYKQLYMSTLQYIVVQLLPNPFDCFY